MVMLKYKGSNPVVFPSYRIKTGSNDIKDEDFWNLMKSKSFANRVNQKIFEVPHDFPLEMPKDYKSEKVLKSEKMAQDKAITKHEKKAKDEPLHDLDFSKDDQGNLSIDHPSMKEILKSIEESKDVDHLNSIYENDHREKVKDACYKRMKFLKSHK